MRIELPWPPKELSPNARVHFRVKAPITKAYREQAFWRTQGSVGFYGALVIADHRDGPITVSLTFHPPDKRRRDADSMFSSCKAAIDGIADALGVNDYRFEFNLKRAEPIKGGAVIVEVT